MDEEHGKQALMKVHCSKGQTSEEFRDPVTGDAVDVNRLTYYADPRLGVMPHTVQHYGLDDPAPVYGNQGFDEIRDYLRSEAGRRTVVWHPETAYWCSFDIDVPLYLPLYAERRFHDLRLLADDEDRGRMGSEPRAFERMDGQMIFSSGWEWGYWLGDVVAARAAWDPLVHIRDEAEAFRSLLVRILEPLGPAAGDLAALVQVIAQDQRELLIGEPGPGGDFGLAPSGQAYLEGYDSLDDIAELFHGIAKEKFPLTQPRRLGLVEARNPFADRAAYEAAIAPLLERMEARLHRHARALARMEREIEGPARVIFEEMLGAARITALRATQIHGLYHYVYGAWDLQPRALREQRLEDAEAALEEAALIVSYMEDRYRVPPERIAAWRKNPTAYDYTYLLTVRELHYWRRDRDKATRYPLSPCFRNIADPGKITIGASTAAAFDSDLIDTDANPLIRPVLRHLIRCASPEPHPRDR